MCQRAWKWFWFVFPSSYSSIQRVSQEKKSFLYYHSTHSIFPDFQLLCLVPYWLKVLIAFIFIWIGVAIKHIIHVNEFIIDLISDFHFDLYCTFVIGAMSGLLFPPFKQTVTTVWNWKKERQKSGFGARLYTHTHSILLTFIFLGVKNKYERQSHIKITCCSHGSNFSTFRIATWTSHVSIIS